MGKIAFVFSGQGAQYSGMGKEVAENVPAAAEVFKVADSVREGTSKQCFEADKEELTITSNTQPCIFTVSLAMAAALEAEGIKADYAAGFSLGELSALTYAKAFTLEEGLRVVSERGRLMQMDAEKHDTGMVAVLKLADEKVQELASKYENVYPVNFNTDGQVSVAGNKEELEAFKADVKEARGLAKPLAVAGAFHSPYMSDASEAFGKFLETADVNAPQIPVFSNLTAENYGEDVRGYLKDQIVNPVLWKKIVKNLVAEGVDTFIELGPGSTLAKMIGRIDKTVSVYNVENMETLQKAVEGVKNA
ncbi:MAG: ACP S-malonyltransferase [Firmicutes bacterium]|nr:ACP S-malonyltransferase [Bacillota bacterium]